MHDIVVIKSILSDIILTIFTIYGGGLYARGAVLPALSSVTEPEQTNRLPDASDGSAGLANPAPASGGHAQCDLARVLGRITVGNVLNDYL